LSVTRIVGIAFLHLNSIAAFIHRYPASRPETGQP
jgi:hypothetical protein